MTGTDPFLEESAQRIEAALDAVLPRADEPPARLHEAMRYAALGSGKRLRPALAFAAARAAGAAPEAALPGAVAVELVHAYSLVHDDLPAMDDDELRRGQPTVHRAFDEATAILAGDALLTLAFEHLAELGPPGAVVRLARAAGSRELVGGQVDDLALGPDTLSVEGITSIHERKTAALFRFALWAGGASAGLDPAGLAALDEFGRAYGLAFQMVDDVLDDDPGECSILRVMEPSEVRALIQDRLRAASKTVERFGPAADPLRALANGLAGRLA